MRQRPKTHPHPDVPVSYTHLDVYKRQEYVLYALPDVNSVSVRELAANAGTDLTALKEYLYGTEFSEGIPLLDKDFSLFEKWCDDLILQKVMQARFKAFGPEPILAYLFAKETEVKDVYKRQILGRQHNDWDVAGFANLSAYLQPIHSRQHNIQ